MNGTKKNFARRMEAVVAADGFWHFWLCFIIFIPISVHTEDMNYSSRTEIPNVSNVSQRMSKI